MKFHAFLLLSLFACTLAPIAQAATRTLTLKEAVRVALENSPGYASAVKSVAVRELEYSSATAVLLPSADVSATHGLLNTIPLGSGTSATTPNPTAPWYSSLSLGISENLYDNGLSFTNREIARLKSDLASLNHLKTRDSLILEVASEFYRYSLASALRDVRTQQQDLLNKQFQNMTNQYRQGLKTKNDFIRLKTQVQRAEIELINAQNSIERSATDLNKLLGVVHAESGVIAFEPIVALKESTPLIVLPKNSPDLALAYDYRIVKVQEEINEKSVDIAHRKYLPRLSATSGITYTNSSYLNSGKSFKESDGLSWNALLTLQYNLWDWGIRKRDVEIARINRDIQNNSNAEVILDIDSQIKKLMFNVSRLSRSNLLNQELLALEEESNQRLQTEYREGRVSYLDLITGLNGLLDAKIQFYSSYFESLQSIAQFNYFDGTVYETIFDK